MKVLFHFLGILLYVIIATVIKGSGFILGGIPTFLLAGATWYLIPRLLINRWERHQVNKKIKDMATKLKISEDIPAHCNSIDDETHLKDYLQTCVDKGLITQDQSIALFDAYK